MKKFLFLLAITVSSQSFSSQSMAAEVVKGKDGAWGCASGGKLIPAGKSGLWASDFPLRQANSCAALSSNVPKLKSGEKPTWLAFGRKGEQGRGVDPKNPGF